MPAAIFGARWTSPASGSGRSASPRPTTGVSVRFRDFPSRPPHGVRTNLEHPNQLGDAAPFLVPHPPHLRPALSGQSRRPPARPALRAVASPSRVRSEMARARTGQSMRRRGTRGVLRAYWCRCPRPTTETPPPWPGSPLRWQGDPATSATAGHTLPPPPSRSRSIMRSSLSRARLVPEIFFEDVRSMPDARSTSSCASRLWPSVDTRA